MHLKKKQEVKGNCAKEGCSGSALMLGVRIRPAEEAHFTSGLSSGVPLQGCTTWPRADVSSRKLSGQVPKSLLILQ